MGRGHLMQFASPFWLLGFVPFVPIALSLLWGRRPRRDVPFLELWRVAPVERNDAWRWTPPNVAIVFALTALLLALIASARPSVGRGFGVSNRPGGAITIILDRGVTMSARGKNDFRFREAADAAAKAIRATVGESVSINPVFIPPDPRGSAPARMTVSQWLAASRAAPPTLADTRDAVQAAVRQALAEDRDRAIVITDASVGGGPHFAQIGPEPPLRDSGITCIAARALPGERKPGVQVLVRVRSIAAEPSGSVQVIGYDEMLRPIETASVAVNLNGTHEADAIVTLHQPPFAISGRLDVPVATDNLDADNRAFLVREVTWPRVEAAEPVGDLQRLLDVYRRERPPGRAGARGDRRFRRWVAAGCPWRDRSSFGRGVDRAVAGDRCLSASGDGFRSGLGDSGAPCRPLDERADWGGLAAAAPRGRSGAVDRSRRPRSPCLGGHRRQRMVRLHPVRCLLVGPVRLARQRGRSLRRSPH